MAHEHITPEMRRCIDECSSCHDICTECVTHCLTIGGRHAESAHIRTMIDCAALCRTAADFMLRGSDLQADVCDICADACEGCAASCDALGDDEMMQRCAEECRRCAAVCAQLAGAEIG